jgi:hypothetical protein
MVIMPNIAVEKLEQEYGFVIMGSDGDIQILPESSSDPAFKMAMDKMAFDAQPTLNLSASGGIPWFMANYIDPKNIKTLYTKLKAAEILGGEEKKGDWTTATVQFQFTENIGMVATYGDYSEDGEAGTNFNFDFFQPYHYQVMQSFGEQEIERSALARIQLVAEKNDSAIQVLNRFQNRSYFYGIAGLQNYGLLNYPGLPAGITPIAPWSIASTLSDSVFEDIRRLYVQLVSQSNGLVDENTPLTLALSPTAFTAMMKTNPTFATTTADMVKKNFPNMEIITAPEYGTAGTGSTQLVQLIAKNVEGQRTALAAFTEKLRAHRTVLNVSSYKRKMSQGTVGAIVFRPFLIASMYGV